MIQQAPPFVTWINVEKPTFDLVGVVLSSLGLAGICAAIALILGTALGLFFIRRGRKQSDAAADTDGLLQLRLEPPRP